MIKFEEVSCRYPAFEEGEEPVTALNGVSFHIKKGSFVAIVGHNGSGKSTVARSINALLRPFEGKITVASMDTSRDDLLWEIRSNAGMVFQNPENQIVSAIVEDDVAFGPENMGVPASEIRTRIDFAMRAAGVYELREKSPAQLSGGQKQRVAVAGVLAMKPKCIIFDESTSMLDPGGRRAVTDIMKKLHEAGTTVIAITHFMEEAVRAERIMVMKRGQVISDGTPAEIFSRPELIEEAGLALPAAVRLRRILKQKGINVPDSILDIEELADWVAAQRSGNVDNN